MYYTKTNEVYKYADNYNLQEEIYLNHKKKKEEDLEEINTPVNFNMQTLDNISLSDLQELQNKGYSVIRSSHLGNQYPSNLLTFALGIPNILYDKNMLFVDKNYNPESLIKDGKKDILINEKDKGQIVPTKKLATHKVTDDVKDHIGEVFGLGELHYKSIKHTFPETEIKNFSERFLENKETFIKIGETLLSEYQTTGKKEIIKQLFDRYISSEGEILFFSNIIGNIVIYKGQNNQKEININNILKKFIQNCEKINNLIKGADDEKNFDDINNKTEGPILSNTMNVLLSGVLEVTKTGKNDIYHCSGPDMVIYVKHLTKMLNYFYTILYKNSDLQLPETLNFNIIPTATVKLYGITSNTLKDIQNLFEATKEKNELNKNKGIEIKKAKQEGKDISSIINKFELKIKQQKKTEKKLINSIASSFKEKELLEYLDDIKKSSSHLTHYDLIGKNIEEINEILMTDNFRQLTFNEIRKQLSAIKKNLDSK